MAVSRDVFFFSKNLNVCIRYEMTWAFMKLLDSNTKSDRLN